MSNGEETEQRDPNALYMWVVYERPRDFPNSYVARLWKIVRQPSADVVKLPTETLIVARTLEAIRARMTETGLYRLPRDPSDDACIVETWL